MSTAVPARFTVWSVLGEGIWVGLYIGVGRVATGSLETASGLVLRIIGLLGAGAIALGLVAPRGAAGRAASETLIAMRKRSGALLPARGPSRLRLALKLAWRVHAQQESAFWRSPGPPR